MKKIIILVTALALSLGAYAQKKEHSQWRTAKKEHKTYPMKEHLVMMNGKMIKMANGTPIEMDKDLTLDNGTMVMTSGMVKTKDGKSMMLKDGNMIYMNGRMSKMKKHKV